MGEADYWEHLEYRVSRELSGFAQNAVDRLWCGAFLPEAYVVHDPTPRIEGRVWIGTGSSAYEEWEFTLLVLHPVVSRDEIDWAALLPPDAVTGWLALDPSGGRLEIQPAAAVPISG